MNRIRLLIDRWIDDIDLARIEFCPSLLLLIIILSLLCQCSSLRLLQISYLCILFVTPKHVKAAKNLSETQIENISDSEKPPPTLETIGDDKALGTIASMSHVMSGLKKLETKSTTKISKKSAPAIAKPFKSAEFVQDSEDEEVGASNVATKNGIAPIKKKAQESSLEEKRASLKSRSALTGRTRESPSSAPDTNDGGSDSQSVSQGESDSGSPEINGTIKVQSMRPVKRLSLTSSPSLERKSLSSDASGTETSADDVEEISTPTPKSRRNSNQPLRGRLDNAKQKAPVTEISRQQTSSVQDLESSGAGQNESDNENEDSSEGQSGSGSSENGSDEESTPVTRKESTYGHYATATLRDMAKSPQCPTFYRALRSTSWLRGCNYFVECPG